MELVIIRLCLLSTDVIVYKRGNHHSSVMEPPIYGYSCKTLTARQLFEPLGGLMSILVYSYLVTHGTITSWLPSKMSDSGSIPDLVNGHIQSLAVLRSIEAQ